ncbi:hypothetical protein [Brevundimonas sp.]|jgi:hypothetical protein|uniref:hypothetical protein n=1 Tax=Brevundimonas sp. TaxID=1871086 RepID=UPI0025BDDC23|nr:hypothetical protein [Brevundimonas sp.]
MVSLTQEDFATLQSTSEEDLLGQLGLAVMGSEGESASLKSLQAASLDFSWPNFIQAGMNYFNRIWPTVKSVVCEAYEAYSEDNKAWIEQAATALLALINVGSAIAILIVKIAIKKGLDTLCAAD